MVVFDSKLLLILQYKNVIILKEREKTYVIFQILISILRDDKFAESDFNSTKKGVSVAYCCMAYCIVSSGCVNKGDHFAISFQS